MICPPTLEMRMPSIGSRSSGTPPTYERCRPQSSVHWDGDRSCGDGRFILLHCAEALEAVLKTSFPNPGDLEKVRALYLGDAQSGVDTLGLRAEFSADRS